MNDDKINNQLAEIKNETFAEKIKRESRGFGKLPKNFIEMEKLEQTGYLIKLVKDLGRPLTENEIKELGNIL